MDCRFCKIIDQNSGRTILRQTDCCVVILSNPRLMPGHLLVIPKRHVEKLNELTKEERDDLFDQVARLQEKIVQTIAAGCDICQHFRPFVPENPFKVSHLHVHLRPRSLNDELYEKVQIHEREIFRETDEADFEKYKKIFGDESDGADTDSSLTDRG